MGGFLRGFSQGITDGQKLGEAWNNASMQREIRGANGTTQTQDPQYSQDQVAQLRDPAEASGGVWDESTQHYKMPNGDFVAPTTTPTYSDGHYQTADGTVVAPKNRFSLGNRTQDTAFTADDIATEKLNRKAEIYSNYGKEDLAEQMRGNALARGLQQRQLKKIDSDSARDDQMSAAYETVNTHNDNTEKIATPLIQAVQTGKMSLQEAMPQILAPYNANLPNGEQLGYDQSKGHLYKTQNGKVEVVKGTDGKPLVVSPEHLDDFLNLSKDRSEKYLDQLHAKLYPELYMDRKKLEMQQKDSDRNYLAGRDDAASVGSRFDQTLKQSGDQFREKQSFDMAVHNDKDAIDQAQLGIQQQELGLKGRLVGAQISNLNRRGDSAEINVSPEQQSKLSSLVEAYGVETDPRKRAVIAQNYEMVRNQVAVANKKYPSLGGMTKPTKDLTPESDSKIREMLQSDPEYSKAPPGIKARMLHDSYVSYGFAEPTPEKITTPPTWQEANPRGKSGSIRPAKSNGLVTPNQR